MEEKTKEKTQETKETTKENRLMKTVEDSRTEQVHLIMHQHLNAGGRLFGGMLMQWVDEVSGVVAMRHCGTYRVTTAAVDNLQFKEPVYEGEILVMIGYVTYVGNTSMEVEIDSYVERGDGMRYLVNRAFSVMVAVDKNERPTRIPGLIIHTEAEKGRHQGSFCSAGICAKSEETPGFKHRRHVCQKVFEPETEKICPGLFLFAEEVRRIFLPGEETRENGDKETRELRREIVQSMISCAYPRSVLL